jgi:hypothetical protein
MSVASAIHWAAALPGLFAVAFVLADTALLYCQAGSTAQVAGGLALVEQLPRSG